jgi:hypothetical protein
MMINPSSSSRAGIVFYQQATVDKWQMGMSVGASPTFDLYTQGASANAHYQKVQVHLELSILYHLYQKHIN